MNLEHNYSNNIHNKKILIIGICPPPLGGIPIHIDRVKTKFVNQNNSVKIIDVIKTNQNKSKLSYLIFFTKELLRYKPDIIYYHTLTLRKNLFESILFIFLKLFLQYNLIFIIHTPRFFYDKSRLYKFILNILINFIDQQILMGNATHESYINNKISLKHSIVESPFLAPDLSKENAIVAKYPESLKIFLNSHEQIIIINGSQIKKWNNIDLYGFDMAIKLINELQNSFPKIGLIIAISSIGDEEYYQEIKATIHMKQNTYLFIESENELWPLIKRSNILIRPTSSDSYAISVGEAISLKVPAIASNVCQRFAGTTIFESRNQEDLKNKVINTLNNI